MCFSAEASFIASGVLATCGAYSIKKTLETKDLSFMCITLIPLLFAIQQFSEGFIWIFLGRDPNLDKFLSYLFLFFAFFIWPIWVPLSLAIYDHKRKKLFFTFAFLGLIFGILLYGSSLLYLSSFKLILCEKSLCYEIDHPASSNWVLPLYYLFTIIPFFLATSNYIKIFGILITLSATFSVIFFMYAFTSVWCFFSALLSIYICYISYHFKKSKRRI